MQKAFFYFQFGRCNLACRKRDCKIMRATASFKNMLQCSDGPCDMECSSYTSTCDAICSKGNCNLKCKSRSCSITCSSNCTVTGGLGTVKIVVFGRNTRVLCANGSSCGEEGCSLHNNCVSYMEDPLNEIPNIRLFETSPIPTTPVLLTKPKPSVSRDVSTQQAVGAAESPHASVWILIATGICIAICH